MKKKILLYEHGNLESSLNYFLEQKISKNAKLLDIGCNYGSLIRNLYKNGYKNIQGVDINKESIQKGKKEYKEIKDKIRIYDGNKLPYDNESFNIILMFDVIEHIPNIKDFLKNQVYRILKKDGMLIFQTPNKLTNIPWEIINQRSLTKWRTYHCSLQTYYSLNKLLKNVGFKNTKIQKYNIYTEHNINTLGKRISKPLAKIFLSLLSLMPLSLNPNFWGSGNK